jgi:hypothetical protein
MKIDLLRGVGDSDIIITGKNGVVFFLNEIEKILRLPGVTQKKGLHVAYTTPVLPNLKGMAKLSEKHNIDKSNEATIKDGNDLRSVRMLGAVPYYPSGFIINVDENRLISATINDSMSGYGKKDKMNFTQPQTDISTVLSTMKESISKDNRIGGEIIVDKIKPDDITGIYYNNSYIESGDGKFFKHKHNNNDLNQKIVASCMHDIYKEYTGKELPIYFINDKTLQHEIIQKNDLDDEIIREYYNEDISSHQQKSINTDSTIVTNIALGHSDILCKKLISLYNKGIERGFDIPPLMKHAVQHDNIKSINERYHMQLDAAKERG